MADSEGPFLATAVLCEKVLREPDGVMSLIRVVDRIYTSQVTVGRPDSTQAPLPPPPPLMLNLVISFKSGGISGDREVGITSYAPSGLRVSEIRQRVLFEGGADRGIAVIGVVTINVTETGMHWFEVRLDGQLATKVPLLVTSSATSQFTPPQP